MSKVKRIKPKKVRSGYIPDEIVAQALRVYEGLQYLAAARLGITGGAISKRIKASPYLQEVVAECVERRIDEAEKTMGELVKDKCFAAACFTLKTKGKSRGYTEGTALVVPTEMAAGLSAMLNQLAATQNALKMASTLDMKAE